eukprot:4042273-Amphidinium_carterae.1
MNSVTKLSKQQKSARVAPISNPSLELIQGEVPVMGNGEMSRKAAFPLAATLNGIGAVHWRAST